MKYSTRTLETRLFEAFHSPFITGILGPRRVGKSTLIDHFVAQHPDLTVVRLNMDRMAERDRIKADQLESIILTTIKRQLLPSRRVWITIDEAQKCPEIFEQIKVLYDKYKDQDAIKFIVTGSALLELHRLSSESLAGRIQLFQLSAFGLSETTTLLHHIHIEANIFDLIAKKENANVWQEYFNYLLPYSNELKQTLAILQIWGGLPEVLTLTSDNDRLDYLANYLQTYLEKDVRAIKSITDLTLYRNLLEISAEQTGSVRDDQRIVQALGCHRDTLNKYRSFLAATLMYEDIYPYINSTLKRLVKSPKGYLLNNGLISFLQGSHDINQLIKTGQIGHRLENWFLNELNIWLNKTPEKHDIHYWRTSSGAEVDFVVKRLPHIYPFEITYGSQAETKKARNLGSFCQDEPKVDYAYYIYMGEFKIDEDKKIIFIPAWAICS